MTKIEKTEKKSDAFPGRTLSEEQIKSMTSDDMILAAYQSQFVDKKNSNRVAHQLLRILLRIVNHHKIEWNQLWYKVELANLDDLLKNGGITNKEWENEQKRLIEVWKPSK